MSADEMPEALRDIVPPVGSTWWWEPMKPHAACQVRVVDVTWNGEEAWVSAEDIDPADDRPGPWLNELSRWVEATVMIAPAPGDE